MSEACVSTARVRIWLTSRITGASLAMSFSRSVSSFERIGSAVLGAMLGFLIRIKALQGGIEFNRDGDFQAHVEAGGRGDGGRNEAVERIGQRDHHGIVGHGNRHGSGVA